MSFFATLKRAVGLGKQAKPARTPLSAPEPEPEPRQAPELTPAELKAQQAAGKTFVLIDVRSAGEQFISHLVGARLLPMPTLPRAMAELDKTAATVVYCAHGYSSLGAAGYHLQQGFNEVYSLKGGIATWQAEGNPVEEPYKQARRGK